MPGGARGVALKLNSPNIPAYADNDGFILEDLNILRFNDAYCITMYHSLPGNLESHVQSSVIELFLNVRIALPAAFLL